MLVEWKKDMEELVGEKVFLVDEKTRDKLSKDYFWYSPVLDAELKNKVADGVCKPSTEEEVAQILSFAYERRIPITTRGAGTGNYGQAVPLEGGILLDLSQLNTIIEVGEGYADVQCGVKLGRLEKELREKGQELCIYPSTYVKATAGGFFSGGSGGIGSITWGSVWDGNIIEAVIYTLEAKPRRLVVSGEELDAYIHNYGTSGIMTQLKMRTAPKTEWEQVIVQFADMENMLLFTEKLSKDPTIKKRLVSGAEPPISSYFTPLLNYYEEGSSVALLEVEEENLEEIKGLADEFQGSIVHVIDAEAYHKQMGLSDFTWNHTTLWALKYDPELTYLQCGFSNSHYLDQIQNIKNKFPREVFIHVEWMLANGEIRLGSLPIIQYKSKERLYEIIDYLESIGVSVNDPHTFLLPRDKNGYFEKILEKKKINDPLDLLNPGKLSMALK
ncbi:FAD-linked oxidase [Salipaludibacillus keqinensis]|uniref:FAD-linked oxidase n=1 Tax=Salipaludibacillus keqinensis TaxID=2045207 RepID=A0A323TQI1_9BACI|nr:FAD-binding oxidoreductase [Salipaludibacillus keqinensis]PYZ94753.1 FAD-linked oxidase [Salipaludibacillus keqinensis]